MSLESKEKAHALKVMRKTAVARARVLPTLNPLARPFMPRGLVKETRMDFPAVAIRHSGSAVVIGRIVALSGAGRSFCVVMRIHGVLATLGNRKPGKPLVHVGRLFALKDAYRVNLKMCRQQGLTWMEDYIK